MFKHPFLVQKRGGKFFSGRVGKHELGVGNYRQSGRKVVQLLLERCNSKESGLNAKDRFGGTPFGWACKNGQKYVVKLFLDHSENIDLNARSNFGDTAFMLACMRRQKDVVKLLVEHSKTKGIDISTGKEKLWFIGLLLLSYFLMCTLLIIWINT